MKLSTEALARLLAIADEPRLPAPGTFPEATGVSFHSNRVRPGDVFFALPGATTHGVAFADAALAAGASFIVSDRAHPRGIVVPDPAAALLRLGRHARAQWRGPVIGITGSAGKTSMKEILTAAMGARSSSGNFNTPLALAAVLVDGWLEESVGHPLVLEMGIDQKGEMAQLVALVQPDAGVLTIVGPSHLDGLGSVDTVVAEKSLLLEAAETKFASAQAHAHLAAPLAQTTATYALAPAEADVVGEIVSRGVSGQTVRIDEEAISLPHLSRANAENAVGAFAVATALGTSPRAAATGIGRAAFPPGRLQPRAWGDGTILDDTYNSNPASAAVALDALRSCPRPHVAVLGDMLELGDLSEALHRELGAATRGLDEVWAYGRESRWIAATNPNAVHFSEWSDLVSAAEALPREGTVLVKASRGVGLERLVERLLASVSG